MRVMSAPPRERLFADTLRSLAAPRRAVPLALAAASLLSAEWLASRSWRAMLIDAALLAAFCVCAPALWRALFARALRSTSEHVAAWVLYAVVGLVLVGGMAALLPLLLGVGWTYVSEPNSRGVLAVLFLVGGWGLGRDIELEASVVHERARAERLAVEAEHAQILALRAQLDPHFLFNTLNAIAEWCREDPRVAERATLDLAALLRGVFDALQTPGWALAREVALLRQLAALYTTRDAGRYRFEFDVDEAATARSIPPLILLPLFENAIKHGPAAGHAGVVVLHVRAAGGDAVVTVTNPGPLGGPREGGAGLASVERRLRLAYGDGVKATLTSTNGTTTASVTVPAREDIS